MRMVRLGTSLLFAAIVGCVHRSPEEEMLQAFASASGDQLFDRNSQPQYLEFADQRSASLFGHLTRDGRYRIAPREATLFCPGVRGEGVHGYSLSAKAEKVMGDSAYATLIQDCIGIPRSCPTGETTCAMMGSGVLRTTTTYLLVRKNGKWFVAKPVSGGEMLLG